MDAEQILERAKSKLVDAGVNAWNITVKIEESKYGIVEEILNELVVCRY